MDLSWPKHFSVNAGVSRLKYLDTYFKLQYPSVDHITDALVQSGPGAMLYKVDISLAFKPLRIDPMDINLLGLKHKDIFLDVMARLSLHVAVMPYIISCVSMVFLVFVPILMTLYILVYHHKFMSPIHFYCNYFNNWVSRH